MSGNRERPVLDFKCPECKKKTEYYTLLSPERRGVVFVYNPERQNRTRFTGRVRRMEKPWEAVDEANGVFCPRCSRDLPLKYVSSLKQVVYILKEQGHNFGERGF